MMLNKTSIDWFSKKQNCVETATYGSEFMAARIVTDKINEMCYMLRMLGVPFLVPVICLVTIYQLSTALLFLITHLRSDTMH